MRWYYNRGNDKWAMGPSWDRDYGTPCKYCHQDIYPTGEFWHWWDNQSNLHCSSQEEAPNGTS